MLALSVFLAAILYGSVGHGGASAYLAVMGLCGIEHMMMKPIALVLNIAVSMLALWHFTRAGHLRMALLWPLVATSVPAAYLGGRLGVSNPAFRILLAAALAAGAWRLLVPPRDTIEGTRPASWPVLAALGGGIGFVSGLVGIGGGIFLTPLLILFRWSSTKAAAALSAAFIMANSSAGLAGFIHKGERIPGVAWVLLPLALAGGWTGARWGSGKAQSIAMRRSLAAVLAIAALKFMIV